MMVPASAGEVGAGGEEPAVTPTPVAAAVAAPDPAGSRWASEIKVYTRKYPNKNRKTPVPPEPSPNRSPLSETRSSIRRSVGHQEPGVPSRNGPAASTSAPSPPPDTAAVAPPSSTSPPPCAAALVSAPPPSAIQDASIRPPPPASVQDAAASPHSAPDPTPPGEANPALAPPGESAPASNGISSGPVPNSHGNNLALVNAEKAEKARNHRARRELRRQLSSELDQVRVLSKHLKLAEEALATWPLPMAVPPSHVPAGYLRSQLSPTGPVTPVPSQAMTVAPVPSQLQRQPLTTSFAHNKPFEKEKRTPKVNSLYLSSEYLLAKDRLPPTDSHPQGRKNSNHHMKKHPRGPEFDAERMLYSQAFKKSSALLSRLLKHKHAGVFDKPVDVKALGLSDYFLVIKQPMDLGTIRGRLSRGEYRNPKEFAADVRLTFHNAMTYNPKGHDVHVMAEQLLGLFEAQWPQIEAVVNYLASCRPLRKEFPPPPIDEWFLEQSDSVRHNLALDSNPRLISRTPSYNARTLSSRKPRAKDPNKRDMTAEEKCKLIDNLRNLPQQKQDRVVQIIENNNLSVSRDEDGIEVDIDSMDAETLWELDRFVANYKKCLSKEKMKSKRAMIARQNAELHAQHPIEQHQTTQEPNISERSPMQNLTVSEQMVPSMPNQNGTGGQNASNSSSSGSSSDSSSSDTDSDSSSSDGSDAANPS